MKQESIEIIKNNRIKKVIILPEDDIILYLNNTYNEYNISEHPRNNSIPVLLIRYQNGRRFFNSLNNKILPKYKGYYLRAKTLNPNELIEILNYKLRYRLVEHFFFDPLHDITTNTNGSANGSANIYINKLNKNSKLSLYDKILLVLIIITLIIFIFRLFL